MPRIDPKTLPPRYQQQIAAQCAIISPAAVKPPPPMPKQGAHESSYPRFAEACLQWGIVRPQAEYRFHPERKWRFDFAWPGSKVALEVEGGVWSKGRHTRGSGFVKDMEKYNAAAILGWRVLKVQPSDLMKRETFEMVGAAMLSS